MLRVSSNITLVLKIFLPTFWFVFFTSFLVAILFVDGDKIPLLASLPFKLGYISMYLIFGTFLFFTVIQLLRVEFGLEKFTISNYLNTYAYAYQDIASIDESNYYIFRLITIKLKAKGSLGKTIRFIPSYKTYVEFVEENPLIFSHLLKD